MGAVKIESWLNIKSERQIRGKRPPSRANPHANFCSGAVCGVAPGRAAALQLPRCPALWGDPDDPVGSSTSKDLTSPG